MIIQISQKSALHAAALEKLPLDSQNSLSNSIMTIAANVQELVAHVRKLL